MSTTTPPKSTADLLIELVQDALAAKIAFGLGRIDTTLRNLDHIADVLDTLADRFDGTTTQQPPPNARKEASS